jgi:phage protein U
MAAETLIALGDFRFSVATASPENIQTQEGWSWAEQTLLGTTPSLQFVSKQAPVKSLRGRIYPEFRGGLDQIKTLKAMAGRGKPMTLTVQQGDTGIVLGDWVILAVDETESFIDKFGRPRKIEFSISLKFYSA